MTSGSSGGQGASFFVPIRANFGQFLIDLKKLDTIGKDVKLRIASVATLERRTKADLENQIKNLRITVPVGADKKTIRLAVAEALADLKQNASTTIRVIDLISKDTAAGKALIKKQTEEILAAQQAAVKEARLAKIDTTGFVKQFDKLDKTGFTQAFDARSKAVAGSTRVVANDTKVLNENIGVIAKLRAAMSSLQSRVTGIGRAQQQAGKATFDAATKFSQFSDASQRAFQSGAVLQRAFNTLGLDTIPGLGIALSRSAGIFQGFNRLAEIAASKQFPALNKILPATSTGMLKFAAGATAGVFAILGFAKAMEVGIKRASDIKEALAQAEGAIRSTGRGASLTITDIDNYARSLQHLAGVDRLVALRAADVAQGFTAVRDPLLLLAAAQNIAVREGVNLESAVRKLGAVLQDPSRATNELTNSLKTLTNEERLQIASALQLGDTQKATGIILDRLQLSAGNAASIFGQSLPGAVVSAKGAFQDLLSDAASPLIKPLIFIVKLTENMALGLGRLKEVAGPIKLVAAAFVVLGAAAGIAALKVAALAIVSTLGAAAIPIGIALAAIGAAMVTMGIAGSNLTHEVIDTDNAFVDLKGSIVGGRQITAEAARGFKLLGITTGTTTIAIDELEGAVVKYREAQQKVADLHLRVIDTGEQLERQILNVKQAQLELNAEIAATAAAPEDAIDALVEYRNALLQYEQAQQSAKDATQEETDAAEDLVEAREDQIAVTKGYKRLLEETTLTEEERLDAEGKVLRANLDLNDAVREQQEAVMDLELAILDLTAAKRDEARQDFITQRTLQTFGPNSVQYRYELEKQKRANIERRKAELNVADSQDTVLDTQQKYKEQLQETGHVLEGYKQGTDEARDANRQLREAEDRIITAELGIVAARHGISAANAEVARTQLIANAALAGEIPLATDVQKARQQLEDQEERRRNIADQLSKYRREEADAYKDIETIAKAIAASPELQRALGLGSGPVVPLVQQKPPGYVSVGKTGNPPPGAVELPDGSYAVPAPAYSSGVENTTGGSSDWDKPVKVEVVKTPAQPAPVSTSYGYGRYAAGGFVPGPINEPRMAIVHGGEEIIPVGGRNSNTSSGAWMSQVGNAIANLYNAMREQAINSRSPRYRGQPVNSIIIQIDGKAVGRAVVPGLRIEQRRLGQATPTS